MTLKIEKWSLLAGMRFVLASIVAVNHLKLYADLGLMSFIPGFGAFEAILGFLLISGYSIGESYTKSPDGFYKRRAFRLYPIYAAALILTYISAPKPLSAGFLGVLALNLLFLNQAFTSVSYVGPAWSLALEVWLYALTPRFHRLRTPTLLGFVGVSLVCYAIHACGRTLFHWPYYSGLGYGFNLLTLAFPWLLGFLLARERKTPRKVMRVVAASFALHIALSVAIQLGSRLKNHQLAGFIPDDLAGFLLKAANLSLVWWCFHQMLNNQGLERRKSRIMRFLGDVSYPLYVVHIAVYTILKRYGVTNPYLMLLTAMATAAAVYQALDFYSRSRERRDTAPQLAGVAPNGAAPPAA